MPNLSTKLVEIMAEIYASSVYTATAITDAKKATKPSPNINLAANIGNAAAATTHAVTSALTAAQIGANEISQVSLAASGLSLICSLPDAIAALEKLGQVNNNKSTQEIYQESENSLDESCQALKTSMLIIGPEKHDNAGRLLFNMPLQAIRSKDHHNLLPYVKENLIKQKRGEAIKFYQKWLTNPNERAKLIEQFNQCLTQYDQEDMPQPTISLGEVAAYLSLLDPDSDAEQIAAFSALFKDMLFAYRETLASDKDCASLLDESNHFLSNLMVTTYTGRAHRKKVDAQNLALAKNVMTGVGIVLSSALAIHTVGLSIPATALIGIKLSSSTASAIKTAVKISEMIRDGSAANEIAQLLTPDVLETLANTEHAKQFLVGAKGELKDFIDVLHNLNNKLQQLQRDVGHQMARIKSEPLFILSEIMNDKDTAVVFDDTSFMNELSKHINDGMSAANLLRTMGTKIDQAPIQTAEDITQKAAKTKLLSAVCELMVEKSEVNRGALVSAANKGELATYLRGRVGMEETCLALQTAKLEELQKESTKLTQIFEVTEQMQVDAMSKNKLLGDKVISDSSIDNLLHASEYTEYLDSAKPKLMNVLESGCSKIQQIEEAASRATVNIKAQQQEMKQKLAEQCNYHEQQDDSIQPPL